MAVAKKRAGRPALNWEAVADTICERIAQGESLRGICADKGMPSITTVHKWLIEQPEFAKQYVRAREEQAEFYADQIVSIADEAIADPAYVAKARLQIDARKWKASKLAPKKYGDKLEVDSTSSDGSMTPKASVIMTPEQFAEIAKEIADKV